MFKIENYIAPLILNKVEKFVKNINQQDFQVKLNFSIEFLLSELFPMPRSKFQVSLWQGDVVFQNLELKLDVLEEELQLPVTFVSGQIQNLKIQIPWSKIASEPIIITINTIGESSLVTLIKNTDMTTCLFKYFQN
jgi:vacuolar protein sorting-associated protein 13B